jgi:hypothetical protein
MKRKAEESKEGKEEKGGREKKIERKTEKKTEKVVENKYSPYPYSGVYFSYLVPNTWESLDNFLKDSASFNLADNYRKEILSKLQSNKEQEEGKEGKEGKTIYFVYPIPNNTLHDNFLKWLKIIQFINNNGGSAEENKFSDELIHYAKNSPFINFHPGNPHMQWRWLWNNNNNLWESFEPLLLLSSSSVSVDEETGKVIYSQGDQERWHQSNMYPIDKTNTNFIVLQYLSPSELLPRDIFIEQEDEKFQENKRKGTDNYSYCGDIQLSWELAAKKLEMGNFEKCQQLYEDQSSLLKKYGVKSDDIVSAGSFAAPEKLKDVIKLMTSQSESLKTLRQEQGAVDWLISRKKQQQLASTITTTTSSASTLPTLSRKRQQQGEIGQQNSDQKESGKSRRKIDFSNLLTLPSLSSSSSSSILSSLLV